MRNLKKFLALVLAMMMVLGMMVTANATSYADESAISSDSREAIEILSAIEVFEGDDGYFNPKSYIRRADFSIVLYKLGTGDVHEKNPLMNALEDQFTDVITGDNRSFGWAAPYVNYSAFKGWLEGDNGLGGPFRPGDNVTYYQVLVCMLRVLGLGDGINAKTWEFDTAEKATRLGLTVGVDSLVGNATREDVAKMAFNALKYTEKKGTIYTVEASGSDVLDMEPLYQGSNEYIAIATAAANEGSKTTETDDLTGSLADVNFNGLHESGTTGKDQFWRPATNWVDKNNKLVASIPWTPDSTYDGTFTYADALAVNKLSQNRALNIFYNGTITDGSSAAGGAEVTAPNIWQNKADDNTIGLWNGNNAATSKGIPGMEVEVYYMGAAGYRVVVREAIVGQITNLVDKDENVFLTVYEASSGTCTPSEVKHDYTLTKPDDSDEDYYPAVYNQLVTLGRGSVVAAYVNPYAGTGSSNGDILEIAPLTAVTSPITRTDDNRYNFNSTVTTANGTFKVNNAALYIAARDGDTNLANNSATLKRPGFSNNGSNIDVSLPATLYFLNQNVMVIDQSSAASVRNSGFGYVYDIDLASGWMLETGTTFKVKLYTENGLQTVDAKFYDNCTPGNATSYGTWTGANVIDKPEEEDFNIHEGGVFVYYAYNSSDGCYRISRHFGTSASGGVSIADVNNGMDASGSDVIQHYTGTVNIKKGVAQGSVEASDGSENLVFDNSTVFYVVEGEPDDEDVTVYVGVNNLPGNYTAADTDEGGAYAKAGRIAYAFRQDVDGANVVRAIVLRNPTGDAGVSGGYFIVGNTEGIVTYTTVRANGRTYYYYKYNAVVDGEVQEVYVNAKFGEVTDGATHSAVVAQTSLTLDPIALTYGNVESYVISSIATSSQIKQPTFHEASSVNLKDTASGAIVINGHTLGYLTDSSLPVFKYDTRRGTLEQIKVGDLNNGSATWKGWYTLNTAGTALTALYVMDISG